MFVNGAELAKQSQR